MSGPSAYVQVVQTNRPRSLMSLPIATCLPYSSSTPYHFQPHLWLHICGVLLLLIALHISSFRSKRNMYLTIPPGPHDKRTLTVFEALPPNPNQARRFLSLSRASHPQSPHSRAPGEVQDVQHQCFNFELHEIWYESATASSTPWYTEPRFCFLAETGGSVDPKLTTICSKWQEHRRFPAPFYAAENPSSCKAHVKLCSLSSHFSVA